MDQKIEDRIKNEPLDFTKGYYRHFKGNCYIVVDEVFNASNDTKMIRYTCITPNIGTFYVRTYEDFFGDVEHEGKIIPRFKFIESKGA